jgi:hypothetical protein
VTGLLRPRSRPRPRDCGPSPGNPGGDTRPTGFKGYRCRGFFVFVLVLVLVLVLGIVSPHRAIRVGTHGLQALWALTGRSAWKHPAYRHCGPRCPHRAIRVGTPGLQGIVNPVSSPGDPGGDTRPTGLTGYRCRGFFVLVLVLVLVLGIVNPVSSPGNPGGDTRPTGLTGYRCRGFFVLVLVLGIVGPHRAIRVGTPGLQGIVGPVSSPGDPGGTVPRSGLCLPTSKCQPRNITSREFDILQIQFHGTCL